MIDAWRKSAQSTDSSQSIGESVAGFLIPFAPPISEWTEEHYTIYSLVELVLGNRQELAPDEQKDVEFAEDVEELIESNDPNWLQKVEEYMDGGYSLDDIPFDEMHEDIDKEQKARGK